MREKTTNNINNNCSRNCARMHSVFQSISPTEIQSTKIYHLLVDFICWFCVFHFGITSNIMKRNRKTDKHGKCTKQYFPFSAVNNFCRNKTCHTFTIFVLLFFLLFSCCCFIFTQETYSNWFCNKCVLKSYGFEWEQNKNKN